MIHQPVTLIYVLTALNAGAIRQDGAVTDHLVGDRRDLVLRDKPAGKQNGHRRYERDDRSVAKPLAFHGQLLSILRSASAAGLTEHC